MGGRLADAPPHLLLEVRGAEVELLYPEERWVGATLRKALARHANPALGERWKDSARTAGWHLRDVESVKEALEGLFAEPGTCGLLLAEDGPHDALAELEVAREAGAKRVVFVLGDHFGLDARMRADLLRGFPSLRAVSLGPVPMLSSQCITVMNYLADRVWQPQQ